MVKYTQQTEKCIVTGLFNEGGLGMWFLSNNWCRIFLNFYLIFNIVPPIAMMGGEVEKLFSAFETILDTLSFNPQQSRADQTLRKRFM